MATTVSVTTISSHLKFSEQIGTLLPPTKEEVHVFARVCSSVCLSVSKITQKTRAWISMKCCVSTDVRTWMNLLTFEPDPDHSPDAGTGYCFLRFVYALLRGILRRENPGAPLQRTVVLKCFYLLNQSINQSELVGDVAVPVSARQAVLF